MLKKSLVYILFTVLIALSSSCGSVSENGATSLFQTAMVSFTATTVNTTSTVTAKPNADDSATAATLAVTVTPYTGITPSSFTVRDLKYTYTQTTGGTAIIIVNGLNFDTSLKYSPILASGDIKDKLIDHGFIPGITAADQPWVFTVQATYTVVEDSSGKSKSYSVPLGTIRFI